MDGICIWPWEGKEEEEAQPVMHFQSKNEQCNWDTGERVENAPHFGMPNAKTVDTLEEYCAEQHCNGQNGGTILATEKGEMQK
jgi:hypothetical protein